MTPQLNSELSDALQAAGQGAPVRVVDPATNETYVLLPVNVYERLESLMSDFDVRDAYTTIDAIMAADDADDPLLEQYQHYRREPNRP